MNGGSIWEHFYQKFQTDGHWSTPDGEYSTELRILNPEEAAILADKAAKMYGATREKGQWGREIGIYDFDKDRTVAWQCPDCGNKWDR